MFWAVSVLRTPVGPQTMIANSVGGGAYLPTEVRLPSTVRLAALDPALPAGWAAAWMGWQAPSAILVDHFERLRYVTAGVRVSAIATSELWPRRPDCGGDFIGVRYEELLRSNVSPLTGAHRLAATDPALAVRLSEFLRGGNERLKNWVAVALTRAIVAAAAEHRDGTSQLVIAPADTAILDSMSKTLGSPPESVWQEYEKDVATRDNSALVMPEIYAPRDADDSPSSQHARLWYEHYYRASRIVEMVMCWKAVPPEVLDIAYCGITAGFGGAVAAAVSEMESLRDQQLRDS